MQRALRRVDTEGARRAWKAWMDGAAEERVDLVLGRRREGGGQEVEVAVEEAVRGQLRRFSDGGMEGRRLSTERWRRMRAVQEGEGEEASS